MFDNYICFSRSLNTGSNTRIKRNVVQFHSKNESFNEGGKLHTAPDRCDFFFSLKHDA